MKFPNLKGLLPKKKRGDDDSDFDDVEDEEEDEEEEEEEDDEDDEDDDDDDEEGGGKRKRRKAKWKGKLPALLAALPAGKSRMAIIGGGATMGVLLLAGVGWLLMSGDGEEESDTPKSMVVMDLPAKGETTVGGKQTPPKGRGRDGGAKPGAKSGKTNPAEAQPGAQKPGAPGSAAGVVIAASQSRAFQAVPRTGEKPLGSVPDPNLIEQSPGGGLPAVGKDGRKPWQVYARPFNAKDDRPRIAIIVGGLGLSRAATQAAITRLPGAVTLAFDPYAKGLGNWATMARQAGHEFLLGLPMEAADFPTSDHGPFGLEINLKDEDNKKRLDAILVRAPGYVGIISIFGSRFAATKHHITKVLEILKGRGLMFVESGDPKISLSAGIATQIGVPRAIADLRLDDVPSRAAIDARLAELETLARKNAVALALASPYASTVARLAAWAATLNGKGLVLAPVTAVADRQFL